MMQPNDSDQVEAHAGGCAEGRVTWRLAPLHHLLKVREGLQYGGVC